MTPPVERIGPGSPVRGEAQADNLSLPPHTRRVFNAFQHLKEQIAEVKQNSQRYGALERQLINLFSIRLDEEVLEFDDTFSELADSDQTLDEGRWLLIEPAIAKRCGIRYGRYRDALGQILSCLKEIVALLGLNHDEPPSVKPLHPAKRWFDGDIRWGAFMSALTTVKGAHGGAVEVQLSRIHDKNQELIWIKADSREARDRIPAALRQLGALRKDLDTTAQILGSENGFSCDCRESHSTFVQIKESFQVIGDSDNPGLGDQLCSLVFHNSTTKDPSLWTWAGLQAEIIDSGNILLESPKQATTGLESNGTPSSSSAKKPKSALKKPKGPEVLKHSEPPKKPRFHVLSRLTGKVSSSEIGDSVEKTKHEEENKATTASVPAPIIAVPSIGLCTFIAQSLPHLVKDLKGKSPEHVQLHESDIILSRQETKLQLKLGYQTSDPGLPWMDPVSIQNQFTSTARFVLTTQQKLELAYKVASSLFYLYSTPWLKDDWDGDDVFLPRLSDGTIVINPLLVNRTKQARTSIESSGTSVVEQQYPQIPPIISRLGRFLIELCCGSSWAHISKVFLAGSAPSLASDADLAIFSEIFSWVEDTTVPSKDKPCHLEGWSYFEAIRNCFLDDYGQGMSARSMNDDDFQMSVYQHILCPLQFALEDFQTRQIQIFGPRISDELQEIDLPANGEGNKAFMLFDDDEVKGDETIIKMKHDKADAWFTKYEEVDDIARTISPRRSDIPEYRIRVAILDTGFDVTNDLLRSQWRRRQLMYRDFVGPETDIPRDEHGHGTHVTSILLKVAPNVDVYMARVSADGKTWKSSQVREAILWAVRKKNVHIISMSFGFPNLDQSLEPIRQAILEAHATDILVFAAAGNTGRGDHISFPACLDEVISVGSTDGKHTISDFVPTLGPGKRLCAIGEGIKAAWINPDEESHATTVRRAGTSYATPVAAGVAAMVMDFLWADRSTHVLNEDWYECTTLRRKRGMLAVLGSMIPPGDVNTLIPWQLFNERDAKPMAGSRCGIIATIIGTLRNVYGNKEQTR